MIYLKRFLKALFRELQFMGILTLVAVPIILVIGVPVIWLLGTVLEFIPTWLLIVILIIGNVIGFNWDEIRGR